LCPAFRCKAETHDSNFSEKRFSHCVRVRGPNFGDRLCRLPRFALPGQVLVRNRKEARNIPTKQTI
jgi:hypothetical protein